MEKTIGKWFVYLCYAVSAILIICSIARGAESDKKPEVEKSICPITKIDKNCMDCHAMLLDENNTPYFGLKEVKKDFYYRYPNPKTAIKEVNGIKTGHYFLTDINDGAFRDAVDFFYLHDIKKIIIEIHSPGGSLFDAWRIIGMIDEAMSNNIDIETRLYGFAASAGFLIFMAGTDRIVSPTAECMWHELMTGEFLAIKTPSDKEDEAKILRHLQNVANEFIANKSKMDKDTLDAKIRKKEFWISGKEAFDLGFATGIIGK